MYGAIKTEENFWSFNNINIIDEIVPAWLYRFARSWRIVSFETYLNNLAVEIFDFVTFLQDLGGAFPEKKILFFSSFLHNKPEILGQNHKLLNTTREFIDFLTELED